MTITNAFRFNLIQYNVKMNFLQVDENETADRRLGTPALYDRADFCAVCPMLYLLLMSKINIPLKRFAKVLAGQLRRYILCNFMILTIP